MADLARSRVERCLQDIWDTANSSRKSTATTLNGMGFAACYVGLDTHEPVIVKAVASQLSGEAARRADGRDQ